MATVNTISENTNSLLRDDECQICKGEILLNPTLKLMISNCKHKFCEACVERAFTKSPTFTCLICKKVLQRTDIENKHKEDPNLEKESQVRKRVLQIYNKRREDFDSLLVYNNYLEDIEDLVFSLLQEDSSEIAAANAKIEKYKQENIASIKKNHEKRAKESKELKKRIDSALKEQEIIRFKFFNPGETKPVENQPAALVAPGTQAPRAYQPVFPTQKQILPQPTQTYAYPQPVQSQPMEGITPTSPEEIERLRQKQAKAAGWKEEFVTARAIEEAMEALFL